MVKCERCGREVRGRLQRHQGSKYCQKRAPQQPTDIPIEQLERVSDVLKACGITPDQLPGWDIAALDELPNMRQYQPRPRRHTTAWHITPLAGGLFLPSLSDILFDIGRHVQTESVRSAEVWRDNELMQFRSKEWIKWIKEVLDDKPVKMRALNMHMGLKLMPKPAKDAFRIQALDVARERYQPLHNVDLTLHDSDANITPRLTQTSRLPAVYGNTQEALKKLDHGCFFVQMPNELITVPANSAHAVVALNSCYVYGHTFTLLNEAVDPSSVELDVRGNYVPEEACQKRVDQLRLGLQSPIFREAYIDHFLETWAVDKLWFFGPGCQPFYEQLLELLANDKAGNQGQCGLCSWRHLKLDHIEHARVHLEGRCSRIEGTDVHEQEEDDESERESDDAQRDHADHSRKRRKCTGQDIESVRRKK
ncbi:hypothetical protein LTR91_003180 [Friedmanniomyces endolithicus]|uniref:Uncharacterized protein n=1 Tax=Friedmanniomyces endolithicus TaxID=329885 RepID=A0AAN6QZW3_9PEZI|nr:hypothetical protein LTS00_016024 [Friedmanniomyces endolithicus]KAK0910975.1 hypothetical protein LTR57_015609 [Friedmanniomyces endolithicus]KAK0985662.1 hypothetical protein LTS01_010144 [Friedmanniomyces endolithicus]KAK1008112.1 hypothetical protein LTR91_003180 [Friedmanniomyces endolithicus]KAK1029193.1 hypothetical protein LTS16_019948 [Friedmanniomyces endolithicus]